MQFLVHKETKEIIQSLVLFLQLVEELAVTPVGQDLVVQAEAVPVMEQLQQE